jgi:mono/diheme cytochrome c family protein
MKRFVFLIMIGVAFSPLILAQQEKVTLKEGPGKKIVEANCNICHSLDYVGMNSPFLDKKGWEASVNKMINVMGAPINKEDVAQIVEYLVTYYGKKE